MQAVDSRLAAEISFAGGFTGFTGGSMTSFTCYSKHTTLPDTIRYYQYLDRLAGYYTERGCTMVRELQGYNIGLAYPHSLGIAYIIIDCLLAAHQGVKSLMLTRHQQGSFMQDVAASRVQTELTYEYLRKAGYDDVRVYPLLRQWLGTFPINHAEGYSVIAVGAAIGVLAGCNIIVLKTVDEGTALPRKEINIESTKSVKAVINMLSGQRFPDSPEMREEMDVLRAEVRAIIDKLYEVGDGDLSRGVCLGMTYGFIDAPFAPNVHVSDRVRPIRDATGAIRMLDFGNLPLPIDVKRYHRQKIAEREAMEGFTASMDHVVRDIMEGALRVPA
jgi:methylaspartate mutase epsilon subunit